MYPDSSFAKPVSSFQRPVPLVLVDPDVEPLICVKFNEQWLAYVIGSLKQLLLQTTWKTAVPDDLNTAQGRAMNLINMFASALECAVIEARRNPGLELDDALGSQIRINPDDECIIQMWCIDHWEDWYDPRTCIATGSGQQTAGAEGQPGPNETRRYCQTILANTPYLYPVGVSTGDVITVDNVQGAWSDGHSGFASNWRCPNGEPYVLGVCGGSTITDGADLMPTQPHMGLVAWIDAELFYIGSGSSFIVPSGISGAQLLFLPNTDDASTAFGSISACVTIETASAPPMEPTYLAGSGPSQILSGGTYVFSSDASSNPQMYVQFPAPVKVTLVSSTLDHPICSGTCSYWDYAHPIGTTVAGYAYPPTTVMSIPPEPLVDGWQVLGGGGGPTYTITAKIEF